MDLLIPSTFAADERDMKLRVAKYGMLARSASIYGVDRIIIYQDEDPKIDEEESVELMEKYLNYAETPPYLRKQLIPHDEDLKYANIMPALQIISHGYSDNFREAVVEENDDGELTLEAGLSSPVTAYGDLEEGERATLLMTSEEEGKIISRDEIDGFWTFDIENRREKLGEVIEDLDKPVVVTASSGDPAKEVEDELTDLDDHALVFGSAWRGIPLMIERGDLERSQIDMMVDFVPEQQTKTVRTEEALPICLGIIEYLRKG